jgi:tRNA(Arg) A34 adenosine deaminase TadA
MQTMDSSKDTDNAMMARCIELSRIAVSKGEYPFGTVIALDGQVVAEAINSTIRDDDVTRHAEVIALSDAQKEISPHDIAGEIYITPTRAAPVLKAVIDSYAAKSGITLKPE